jgi:hypothetical protein
MFLFKMKTVLLCGYRCTGKDSICNILMGKSMPGRFMWRIYKHPARLDQRFECDSSTSTQYHRVAFADQLKQEAGIEYGIPLSIPDTEKDIKQFTHHKTGQLVSARDIYIEWGAIRRSQDPNYWCKIAFKSVPIDDNITCVATDWRFRNEGDFVMSSLVNVVTARVYRSEVPEPDITIGSEHDLDNYQTSLLLLRDDDAEFDRAVARFPQYRHYVPCETL